MTENSAITVGLEVTETYEQSFDRARLLDVAAQCDQALAAELQPLDESGIAAALHRLQLDQPHHPLIEYLWDCLDGNGEVASEQWTFSCRPADRAHV